MKVLVLYRPDSEFTRSVEEFVHDLRNRHNIDDRHLELIDIDSRDGIATASLYDIMTHPTVMIIGDDGGYIKGWESGTLPLIDEVISYVYSYQ